MTATDSSPTATQRRLPRISRAHIPLIVGAIIMVLPLIYMISVSLTPPNHVFDADAGLLPKDPTIASYLDAFARLDLGRGFVNSLVIAVPVTVGAVITSSMAGFAFARLEFVGRTLWFLAILMTIMVPVQVRLIAEYIGFSYVGLLDTYWPLILPAALNSAFGVFLMRQYFLSLPREMDEAAELDGANPWQFFWQIVLPQAKAPMGALALFTFLASWNDFFAPLIFLTSDSLFTLPLRMASTAGLYGTEWALLMAAACVAILPSLIAFILLRKYIVAGVSFTGAGK